MPGTTPDVGLQIPFLGKGARLDLSSRSARYRWLCIFLLSFSGDGWTSESSVLSAIINLPEYIKHLGYGDTQYLPAGVNNWIGPVYSLGQLFGGIAAAYVGDWFGRKWMLSTGCLLVNLCTALLIWSPNVGTVIFARVVEGFSIGFLLLGYQIYAVEIANRNERGFLSGLSLITGNVFSLAASAITYGLTYAVGNWGWRLAFGVSFIPANILLFSLPWIPESPRWLYEKSREDEARAVFMKLHGHDEMLDDDMEREYQEMKVAIAYDKANKMNHWRNFFNTSAARYRTFVAVSSQFIWAWNGQSVWTYYFTYVFDAAGFSDVHIQFALNAIQGAMWVVGSTVGAYLLDVTGHKFSLLVGIGQMSVCLFVQGALSRIYFDKGISNHKAGIAFVSFYIIQWVLWVTFFSSVVNMYPAELFPAPLRNRGYAMANVVSMGVGFATQYSGFPMYQAWKGGKSKSSSTPVLELKSRHVARIASHEELNVSSDFTDSTEDSGTAVAKDGNGNGKGVRTMELVD
ncbi:hypothetical protein YB2330_004674 [Saitoella coloradoensis]